MEAFEFFIPQNIMVGAGTMAKLPECAKKLGGSHAMLISGPTLRKMGIVDKAADYLKEAGMKVDIFTDVEANPSVTTVEKATEAFKEAGADFIVALGGGSPMDVAKAVGASVPRQRLVTAALIVRHAARVDNKIALLEFVCLRFKLRVGIAKLDPARTTDDVLALFHIWMCMRVKRALQVAVRQMCGASHHG